MKSDAERRAYMREWKRRNKSKVMAYEARRMEKNPEKFRALHLAATLRYNQRNREKVLEQQKLKARARRIRDPEKVRQLNKAAKERKVQQNIAEAGRPPGSTCEICSEFHLRIVFDHCHANGHFRGWICDRCNRVLGLCYDSPELLNKLALYLENDRVKAKRVTSQVDASLAIFRAAQDIPGA